MRTTKWYLARRVEYLATFLNLEGQELHLSRHHPGEGDYPRYQIEIRDAKTKKVTACFPRHGHIRTAQFTPYLEGMIDALADLA